MWGNLVWLQAVPSYTAHAFVLLQMGCGSALPALYCLCRGATVHFQDYVSKMNGNSYTGYPIFGSHRNSWWTIGMFPVFAEWWCYSDCHHSECQIDCWWKNWYARAVSLLQWRLETFRWNDGARKYEVNCLCNYVSLNQEHNMEQINILKTERANSCSVTDAI